MKRGRRGGLLEGATNFLGPIGPQAKKRILRYLGDPSTENWDDVYGIIINEKGGPVSGRPRTIWQAVIAVDPTFRDIALPTRLYGGQPPEARWAKWPDALLLARAIKAALDPAHGRYK